MIDLGTVQPGSTIRIPFATFNTAGAAVTMTNFTAADILIYKDGGTTERASTSGFTATTDFDSKTGKQLAVIDLSDNTTADFFAAGSEYLVAIDSVTVDSQTVGTWVARFKIGYREAVHDTTIATISSQTSFTLTAGPADDSALVGCIALIHDAASAVQRAIGVVSAYTGSTKTVMLAADPAVFTMAAKDNISFFVPSNTRFVGGTPQTAKDLGAINVTNLNTLSGHDPGGTLASTTNITAAAGCAVSSIGANAITATSIAADAITDAKVASDVTIASVTGAVGSVTGAVGSVTGNVGGSVASVVGLTPSNLDATISSRASAANLAIVAGYVDTEITTLQASVDDLPTNSELATALGTADDVVLAAIAALTIPTAAQNAAALMDLSNGVETGLTPRQAMRLMVAAAAGKLSGAATTTIVIRNAVADSKDRITATVDTNGNRSAITLDLT